MRDATIARCTQTPNNIRANNRLRDCNQQYCSAAAPEATRWGVSVRLLHLVRNRWQCDVRPAFGRRERVLLHRSFNTNLETRHAAPVSCNRAESVFDSLRENAATETCCASHVLCVTLPVCDRDMGPGPDQHL
jgi:hypothetical protein